MLFTSAHAQQENTLPSPLKQIQSGIVPQNVKCELSMILIFKKENGSPACVYPDTAIKLTARGWSNISYKIISPIGTINLQNIKSNYTANYTQHEPKTGGGNLEPCPSNQYFDNGICRNKGDSTNG